jgi:hypothetical protein
LDGKRYWATGHALWRTNHDDWRSLWAIGYDDMARADQVRDEITRLGWGSGQVGKYLFLYDIAVVVRHADGSFVHHP